MAIERIGLGYDLHRLVEGRKLILAGVPVEFHLGLAGHSDADVVLHALIDAMLGAAGLPDIGQQFPDNQAEFKDIDSGILTEKTVQLIAEQGFKVANTDVTIITEQPRLSDYKPKMRQSIADSLMIRRERVSVKAKTNEGLGETGTGQAIACYAVVGLELIKKTQLGQMYVD